MEWCRKQRVAIVVDGEEGGGGDIGSRGMVVV